eukprot:115263_1
MLQCDSEHCYSKSFNKGKFTLSTKQLIELFKSSVRSFADQIDDKCCSHHPFQTTQLFIKYSTKQMDKEIKMFEIAEQNHYNLPDMHNDWSKCCEECYVHVVMYLYSNWLAFPLPIIFIDICGNLLNYRAIATLIFRQSDLFIKMFEYAFAGDRLQILHCRERFADIEYYQIGHTCLLQTITNASLMKPIHWKILACYFENVLKAITAEFESGVYVTMYFGPIYMNCLFMFMVFMLKHTRKNRNKRLLKLYDRKWRQILKETEDQSQIDVILEFLSINNNNNKLIHLFNALNSIIVEYDNMRWNEMKCFRCRVNRLNVSLMKCKSCKVIRYCSKKCQKIDWNQHNHRQQCKRFRQMKKKK